MDEQDTFPIDNELFGKSSYEDMVEESEKASLPPEDFREDSFEDMVEESEKDE